MTPSQRRPSAIAVVIDPLEPVERLGDRAVDVLAVVGLRSRQEDADLVEALAFAERVVEPALIRDQDREGDVFGTLERREHRGAVGELRDHVGADERGDLDPLQARGDEHLDQPDLVGRRDHLRLVLKAVARADLADPHAGRISRHQAPWSGTWMTRR